MSLAWCTGSGGCLTQAWQVLTAGYMQERGSGIAGTTGYARTHNLPHGKVLPVNHGRGAIKLYPLGLHMRMQQTAINSRRCIQQIFCMLLRPKARKAGQFVSSRSVLAFY